MFMFKAATADDADDIARIIIRESGGIVDALIGGLITGLAAADILSAFLSKGEAPYSIENVIKSEKDGVLCGLLFSYPAAEHCVPGLMESFVPAKRLKQVRPALECAVPGSLYINTLWWDGELVDKTFPHALLLEASSRRAALGLKGLSAFCWNDNEKRMRFLFELGFTVVEDLPPDQLSLPEHPVGGSLLYLGNGKG